MTSSYEITKRLIEAEKTLDAHGKSLCDALTDLSDGSVLEIRFPFRFKEEEG